MPNPLRVLILEDDAHDAQLTLRELSAAGYEPQWECVDTEAEYLKRLNPNLDLILSDYQMPQFDGLRALALLQQLGLDIPFIIVSGTIGEQVAVGAMKAGAADYLLKDRLTRLGAAVDHALHEKRLRDEARRASQDLQESNRQLAETLQQLHAVQDQLVQQERLHALGQMAGGIAHDFNNALAPILGFTELLLQHQHKLDNRQTVLEFLGMMNTCAKDAAHVVHRLREFYRHREAGDVFLPVNLAELAGQVVNLTSPRWKDQARVNGASIHMCTELNPVPTVYGDESALREALTNLLFNAVDAMPKGGTLTVRTHVDAEQVILDIIDTGIGMSEEVRHRCLEPFFTTKGNHGTGLGLAMVYGIIQRHGGTIAITSQTGRGTTFTVQMPVEIELPTVPVVNDTVTNSRPLRVLVVDDEPAVLEIITEYLREDGHTVVGAADGPRALREFQKGKFDLAIVDRSMPTLSGDQLAKVLKEMSRTTPILMLTGFGFIMDETQDRPEAIDLVLTKPITIRELRQAVAQLTRRAASPPPTSSNGVLP